MILFILGIVSLVTDVFIVSNFTRNATTALIIFSMIIISSIIRLIQELRAKSTAAQLDRLIHEKVTVRRNGELREIPGEELVVGDLVLFSAGDRVPADIRLTKVTDLSVLLYILSNILLKTFLLPIYNNLSSITKSIFFF